MSRSARKISQTFNGRTEWVIGGANFFKLLSSVNPVDVELYDRSGLRLVAAQIDGGFYQRIDFDRVVITTGANELVEWMFAPDEGGSDRFTGVVDMSDDAARLLGLVTPRFSYGSSFVSTTLLAANTPESVIAAASNLNGYTVWDAYGTTTHATLVSALALLAKATAPASTVDGDQVDAFVQPINVLTESLRLRGPRLVASGKRLDFVVSVAEAFARRTVLYTVH